MSVWLHSTPHPAAAHEAVFLPWLRTAGPGAVVVVPFRSDAYFLKALALTAGPGVFGVEFITPGELRERLSRHCALPAKVPLREHLHLLLAAAAERLGDSASAPDQLLKAIDLLSAGGWSFGEAGPAALRPVVAEFEQLVARAGFQLMHDADRALLDRARTAPPLFPRLFVIGFNGLHWPLWPLLAAATHTAGDATVCLTDPRAEAETLDATWIGTWEEAFGSSVPVPADDARPFVDLLRLPESKTQIEQRHAEPARSIEFLVGQNTAEQAQAIVSKALHFLADPACERLGILFPAAGALSRRVAALLADLALPHNDGLAHHAPGPLEDAAWPAWIELQESPRLPALLRFLRAQPDQLFAGLPYAEAEDALTRTFNDLLIDDLAVLAEYLARHPRKRHAVALTDALRALPFLPEHAKIGTFIHESDAIFRALGWTVRADELARLAADWRGAPALAVSRRAWLRWLGETLVSWRAVRAESGNHPYSRVHLLPFAQAESQAWTHLIAAGLNEGQWPPKLEDSGFIGEEEIDALNRRIRVLNQRATAQGSQGEGHETVQPGKALCLGPAQRRELALRQFLNTLESATIAVAASAQLFDEAAPDRRLNPSDFFTRLYFCARGRAVSQDAMIALRAETARWLGVKPIAHDLAAVRQTRVAFDARRDSAQPFGEYEFALRSPLPQPLRLTATQWENALKTPALVWMGKLLGVGARDAAEETPWSLATGQWVHQWLRDISDATERNAFAPLPPPAQILARVHASAAGFCERIHAVLHACDRGVPDWWLSAWHQALHLSEQLAERIAEAAGHTHLATEWKLTDTAITLGDGVELHVNGRIDLILTTAPTPDDAWIVDYKTGTRKALSAGKLATGDGLQLALYALALQARGVSLLTPALDLAAPQLTPADLAAQPRLWRGLHRMQERGVFGMKGALREEFAFRGDYPLATLAIDAGVLDEKWTRTHPELCDEEEPA